MRIDPTFCMLMRMIQHGGDPDDAQANKEQIWRVKSFIK